MNDFDILLHRTILDGKQFDKLIPATECARIDSGNGNTELSMEWIKEMSLEFHPQMQKIAKVLQKETLQKTCEKIHWFAYNHFQYMADDDDQMLRSPACSWKERHTGIDCKSYSIIASALLLNLELKHYIRKIKQPGFAPTEWTHVYVVVPKNQKTGSLNEGYFVIDGTIPQVSEPPKIDKKDLPMDHYKLNGASPQQALNGFKLDDIKGYMSMLSCIGGSAYTGDLYKSNVSKIVDFFNETIAGINNAIANNNMAMLSDESNELRGMARLMEFNFFTKKGQKSWNSCTTNNFNSTIDLAKFYSNGVANALQAYLDNYYTKTANGSVIYKDGYVSTLGIWGLDGTANVTMPEPKFNYTLKSGVTSIPKFEITPYVADKLKNPGAINLQELLSGLSTVIKTFSGSSSDSGNGNYTTDPNYGNGNYTTNLPKTQEAGFGVVGWVVVAVGLSIVFTQMKDKPLSPQKIARKPRKTTVKK